MSELQTFNKLRYPISDKPTAEEFSRLPPELYNEICGYLGITFFVSFDWQSEQISISCTIRERREIVRGIRHRVGSYESD